MMAVNARSKCRDCDAPVRWARSKKTGSWMILDRDPVPGGNISLAGGKGYADGADRATVHGHAGDLQGSLQLDLDGGEKVLAYRDHHASCPFAEKWRR